MASRDVLHRQDRLEVEFGIRHRPPEQISLREVYSGRFQGRELRWEFDALRDGRDIETARQCDGGGDHGGAIPSRGAALHDRAVDLEFVEWKTLKIACGGIAYSAIIEHHAN